MTATAPSASPAGRGPALHPLEIVGVPRRRYLTALGLQLVSTAALVSVGLSLAVADAAGSAMLIGGVLVTAAGWAAGRTCTHRAWSGLPRGSGRRVMPVSADRRFTALAALLLTAGALVGSMLGPAGAFMAVVFGLDTALVAVHRFCQLAGRDPYPARRAPAMLTATAACWVSAATVGGLGSQGVLLVLSPLTALVVAMTVVVWLVRWSMPRKGTGE